MPTPEATNDRHPIADSEHDEGIDLEPRVRRLRVRRPVDPAAAATNAGDDGAHDRIPVWRDSGSLDLGDVVS